MKAQRHCLTFAGFNGLTPLSTRPTHNSPGRASCWKHVIDVTGVTCEAADDIVAFQNLTSFNGACFGTVQFYKHRPFLN